MFQAVEIYKKYGRREILKGASLTAEPGQCIGIVGGNGCGKTTFLSILAGARRADSGKILFDGIEAGQNRKLFSEKCAYVPQENPLMEELTVRDNLKLWYRGDRAALEADLESGAAAMLKIPEMLSMTVGKLSGGMKKRLSIACALSNHAPVLIMDEPGAALDFICKEDIKKYLLNYKESGGTVILASHELSELSICDRMLVLNSGKLREIPRDLSEKELAAQF